VFTRAGFELDLAQEVALSRGAPARLIEPGLLALPERPRRELAFARQMFRATDVLVEPSPEVTFAAVRAALRERASFALHVTSPDSDDANRLSARAGELAQQVRERLREAGRPPLENAGEAREQGGQLVQVCLLASGGAVVGAIDARDAPSLHPGGRRRLQRRHEAPSRAALKLEEAFEWLGRRPERGERCADLGAAPGGWTHVLLGLGVRVVAVDPAKLAPELLARHGLKHVKRSAFDYQPEEPFDWVFCDMAWRPLEVAAMLAKWGRRGFAQALLTNVKLPMKRRAEMIERVRGILESGGWQGLRVRQLYHDRDEVTLAAWKV